MSKGPLILPTHISLQQSYLPLTWMQLRWSNHLLPDHSYHNRNIFKSATWSQDVQPEKCNQTTKCNDNLINVAHHKCLLSLQVLNDNFSWRFVWESVVLAKFTLIKRRQTVNVDLSCLNRVICTSPIQFKVVTKMSANNVRPSIHEVCKGGGRTT